MDDNRNIRKELWEILSNIALELIETTGVNILFNEVQPLGNYYYKLCYEGSESLYKKILSKNLKEKIKFESFWKEIEEKLSKRLSAYYDSISQTAKSLNQQIIKNINPTPTQKEEKWFWVYTLLKSHDYVYQHSLLGFAPTVLELDTPMTFYALEYIPARTPDGISQIVKKNKLKEKVIIAYELLKVLESYLGIEKEGASSIVTIYPLSPFGFKKAFIFLWVPYKKGNLQEFYEAKTKLLQVNSLIDSLMPKILSLFTLYLTSDLIFSLPSSPPSVNEIMEKWFLSHLWVSGKEIKLAQKAVQNIISYVVKIQNERTSYALRSAVAAIVGRNASHTIGSHALSYLSEQKNLENYSYGEISKFYRYLQGRLDYIAEASTSEPKWSETVEFKNDILIPFIEQKILLDNINRSEYIINGSDNKVEMRAEKYEFILKMTNKTYRFRYKKNNGGLKFEKERKDNNGWRLYENEDKRNDIIIDCPHGIVGCHAFYSFIENFIRNSCKHGGEALKKILQIPEQRLQITIEIDNENKGNNDLIRVKIYDNLGNCNEEVKGKIDKYIKGDEKDFCDETGKLRGGAWGIYEMRIGTGWLRQANILDISANSLEPPLLKIDNPSNNITYEFYLLRPLNYLFVTEDQNIKGDIDKGIYKIKSLSELEDLYKERKLRHKFVIIEVKSKDEIEWLKKQENQIKLPFRTFVFYNYDNFENDIKELKNKFVCVKGVIRDIQNIQQLYVEWLYDKDDSLSIPPMNIIWGELKNNKYYKPDLNSVDDNAIIYKHGMETDDINKLKNKNPLFFQPFSSSVPENIVGRKLADYKNSKRMDIIYELYEVGLFRILIADERIFKKVCEKDIDTLEGVHLPQKYKLWKVWKWMGVDIIDIKKEGEDIYVWTPEDEKKKMDEFFNSKKWTIFLIHQGIIDEQLNSEFFKNGFIPKYQNCFRQIFIHSGRGEVKIEKGFKFVELSNLENYVINNPNKYRLVNLLAKVIGSKET